MSKIDYKKLHEIVKTVTAPVKIKTENYQLSGKYPIIDQGKGFIAGYTDNKDALLPFGEYILYGDHTLTVKYINGSFAQGADGLKILICKEGIVKYIYYALCAFNINSAEYKRHWSQAKQIEIPIPDLSIQREIVSVLDSFTMLIDKMKQEVELRKKQIEYYREKLICEQNYPLKAIGEIGDIDRGSGLQKKDFTESGIGCIHYGQIYTRLNSFCDKTLTFVMPKLAERLTKVHHGDLVIACTSENIEDVCKSVVWLGEEDIVTGGHACVLRHKESPKYISYCFQTLVFASQKAQFAYGTKVIDMKTDKIKKIEIPIPSISTQRSIVSTLDPFEQYISKLERLITLREKQYAYYREKLLTFE